MASGVFLLSASRRVLRAGNDRVNRSILATQIRLRGLLNLCGRDRRESVVERVDLVGIIVEERERREQVQLSESRVLLEESVESCAHLRLGSRERRRIDQCGAERVDLG